MRLSLQVAGTQIKTRILNASAPRSSSTLLDMRPPSGGLGGGHVSIHLETLASANCPLAHTPILLFSTWLDAHSQCACKARCLALRCFCPKEATSAGTITCWGQYVIVVWCRTHLAHYAPTCRAYSSSLHLLGSLRSQVIPLGPTPPLPCLKTGRNAAIRTRS